MSDKYEVITYEDVIVFNYSLPGEDVEEQINREVTLVWEDTLEKFFEAYKPEKAYKINSFEKEKEKNKFISDVENETEKIIDEVDEEIGRKMKFAFDYTSPTHED
ncbi:hypothetical protein HUE87_10110 [Candidatus Sulfurimonas marisnigri]|uniref:Uncharacterized protein n=1 Tax=Candidatus Sulfurimonas marisnigri TaxID=2740405 RepID=A0A7S7RQ64_9BACT|nr:hypothetical protein [Candidatus Sulfurimonas marisnigri]QOY54223.1 hypothetical protein HUE87_10110 [Candidatus Sulfurimonas marisnigri]